MPATLPDTRQHPILQEQCPILQEQCQYYRNNANTTGTMPNTRAAGYTYMML